MVAIPSFYNLTSGATVQAQDIQQVIDALKGTVGLGVPLSPTAVNDSVNFALTVKNTETTNSRALQVLRANNNVLLQADVNGVIVSPDGGAATAQVVNLSATQTLTNKTLTAPHVTALTVDSGGVGIGAAPNTRFGVYQPAALTLTGGTTQYGFVAQGTGDSGGTSEISGMVSGPATAATAFTCTTVADFHAQNPVKGAGSTITSAYGLLVDAITSGNTNNYGVYINAPSSGSGANAALYVAGGEVVLGGTITTTATTGFTELPACAGAPTGAVSNLAGAPLVYDTTNQKLWVRSGGVWRGVVLA